MLGDVYKMAGSVVRRWGVEGVDGQCLVDVCTERWLFLVNTFQHRMIHRYIWRRGSERSCIVCIAKDHRLKRDVLNAKVV